MARRATVQVVGFEETKKRIGELVKSVTSIKERHQVLVAGARVVRDYSKNVIMKDIKSPYVLKYHRKGQGQVAAVLPGNLKQSMYVFRQRDGNVSVGPRVLRRINAGSILGAMPKTSSGWYAHMIFKSSDAFRRRVTLAAQYATYSKVLRKMELRYKRIFTKWQKKYNL